MAGWDLSGAASMIFGEPDPRNWMYEGEKYYDGIEEDELIEKMLRRKHNILLGAPASSVNRKAPMRCGPRAIPELEVEPYDVFLWKLDPRPKEKIDV